MIRIAKLWVCGRVLVYYLAMVWHAPLKYIPKEIDISWAFSLGKFCFETNLSIYVAIQLLDLYHFIAFGPLIDYNVESIVTCGVCCISLPLRRL